MPAPRSLSSLVVVGLIALPGCLLPVATTTTTTISRPPAQSVPPTAGTDRFAEFITAPGQRVPLADPPAAQVAARDACPIEPPAGMVVRPDPSPADPNTLQASAVAPLLTGQPVSRQIADPPLIAALRAHLDGHPAAAADHLKKLPRANQQLLGHLLPAAADAGKPGPPTLAARHVAAAAEVLADPADLAVRKAVFVDVVRKFGDYDPVPAGYQYLPGGSGSQAVLYIEVDRPPLAPVEHPTGGKGFVIRLDGTAQVRDAADRVVEQPGRDGRRVSAVAFTLAEVTRSPVRDFHFPFAFPLPPRPGQYRVTVELKDPHTGRSASVQVPFVVGGG